MFPQGGGPSSGNGFTTSSVIQQNNSLLGNPQFQNGQFPTVDPASLNSTAPQSGAPPGVTNMIKALKGGGTQ
jgi:hypothetical protein